MGRIGEMTVDAKVCSFYLLSAASGVFTVSILNTGPILKDAQILSGDLSSLADQSSRIGVEPSNGVPLISLYPSFEIFAILYV